MDLGLTGKHALVLGSSQGLGFAIARGLLAEGASVMLCGRDAEKLARAAATLDAPAERMTSLVIDLSSRESVADAIERIGGDAAVDILVNNSGGPPPGPISAVAPETWTAQFEAMVGSLFRITGAVLPGMRARHWGRIVNVVSSGVTQPIPNLGISNTLRASIIGWAKTLSDEVAPDGVTVNSVLPGRIHTARVDQLDGAAAVRTGRSRDEVAEAARTAIPARRYGDPAEFADMVVFLASQRAAYVTGGQFRVDGGAIRAS